MRWPVPPLWKWNSRSSRWGRAKGSCFFANILQSFSYAFAQWFQGGCYRPYNSANDSPGGKDNSRDSEPIIFEDFLYFFEKRRDFSLSSISVLSCESSNLRSATLASAASFPEEKAFSSFTTALSSSFWRSSSNSWPLRSSSGFVLLSLSSSVFLSFSSKAILRVSLSTFFVISLSVVVAFVCHKALFSPFKIVLKIIFSLLSVFAIRSHFHVLRHKPQSWLGFVRFYLSDFAPHHWLVGDRRQFFPSPLVVFLVWSIYCPLQWYLPLLGQEYFWIYLWVI